ncbi:unnamed protein product [Adineta ricciae]|uniref:Peptidase C1A papain C-terminal domain-containing protein n=1 Tax=Adineta ricciae TaxID=249248 RepID=A0A815BEG4_ADIRI|nr:unnamed protein product [Adineta ricciae]
MDRFGDMTHKEFTNAIKRQHFVKSKQLVSLFERNLVDCSDNEGIDAESSYPYEARDGQCRFIKGNVDATDTGYVNVLKGSEQDLQVAVVSIDWISVAIDASQDLFQFICTVFIMNDTAQQ